MHTPAPLFLHSSTLINWFETNTTLYLSPTFFFFFMKLIYFSLLYNCFSFFFILFLFFLNTLFLFFLILFLFFFLYSFFFLSIVNYVNYYLSFSSLPPSCPIAGLLSIFLTLFLLCISFLFSYSYLGHHYHNHLYYYLCHLPSLKSRTRSSIFFNQYKRKVPREKGL